MVSKAVSVMDMVHLEEEDEVVACVEVEVVQVLVDILLVMDMKPQLDMGTKLVNLQLVMAMMLDNQQPVTDMKPVKLHLAMVMMPVELLLVMEGMMPVGLLVVMDMMTAAKLLLEMVMPHLHPHPEGVEVDSVEALVEHVEVEPQEVEEDLGIVAVAEGVGDLEV